MDYFHKILATVKDALAVRHETPVQDDHQDTAARPLIPVAAAAHRAELLSLFAHELEGLGARFLGAMNPAEAIDRAFELIVASGAHSAAIGTGLTADLENLRSRLKSAGIEVIAPGPVDDQRRGELRQVLGRTDFSVVEADYAIAASGSLVVVSTEHSPGALTLLPPKNLVMIDVTRLMPDLGTALSTLGTAVVNTNRVSIITGPSRTADIEKLIVLGVHGPVELYVLALWPQND